MLTGFQLSAPLRLRSLLQSGWEKGRLAKAGIPSPGEATKKLHPDKDGPRVGPTESAGCRSGGDRGLGVGGGAGGGAWASRRRTAGPGAPQAPPRPTAPPHAGSPAPERGVGTAPRSGPARARWLGRAPAACGHQERREERQPQPTASCFLPPQYGESSPGEGSSGEGGEHTHTQPPARRTPRGRGHVPVESPRDLPRLHKAPRSGQAREGAGHEINK